MIPLLRAVSAALAAGLILGLSSPGGASPRGGNRILLRAPDGSGEAGGSVVVKLRAGHRGETMRLRVRGLEGSSEYLVRDRVGGGALRSFRTGRGGAGSLRIANAAPESFGGMLLEVVDPGEGGVVLEGDVPLPDMHSDGTCVPPGGAGHDDHAADHHAADPARHGGSADHHGDSGPGHHGAADPGTGGDMHGSGGHM